MSQLKRNLKCASYVLRERHQIRIAAKHMPKPMPFEWAAPRLVPLLAGPSFHDMHFPVVVATSELGCAVEFGVDLGNVYARVDALVAERWERSPEQLLVKSLENLRRRASTLGSQSLSTGTFSGRLLRMLRGPRYAASLVLLPDELKRLFGSHDQWFATPSQSFLMSLPRDMPLDVAAETVVDLEMGEAMPLLYDPFVLEDGVLMWQTAQMDSGWDAAS